VPNYARTTASLLLKDNELNRIPDENTRKFQAEQLLHDHDNTRKEELQDLVGTNKFSPSKSLVGKIKPIAKKVETSHVEIKEVQVKTIDKNFAALRQNVGQLKSELASPGRFDMTKSIDNQKSVQDINFTNHQASLGSNLNRSSISLEGGLGAAVVQARIRPLVDILNEVIANQLSSIRGADFLKQFVTKEEIVIAFMDKINE